MSQNLEYIYTLRDRYSKKLAAITKKQLAFTQAYAKSMGKVNAAAVHHGRIIAKNTQLYNSSKQAIGRVNSNLERITATQRRYSKESTRRISKLNSEWRKHGKIIAAQQMKQARARTGMGMGMVGRVPAMGKAQRGPGLAGMASGIGGAFLLKGAIDTSAAFYQNLNAIEAVKEGIDIDKMKKKALEWGISTKFSAIQVSGAMKEAAQAGMEQNEILASMPGNLALAAAGNMDLVSAMILSTDVVNQFGRSVSNLAIADQLAAAASSSTSTVIQLGAALQNTGSIAHQAGMSSKDTIKMLMALGETGLRGEAGGTFLMNMLIHMKRMNPKLRKGFKKFLTGTGISISDMVNTETGKILDPGKFSKLLITASDKQLNALISSFEIRGGKAVGAMAQLSSAKLEKFNKVMENTEGAANRMAITLMKGLPGGLKLLDSAWETTKIVMIDSFVAPMSKVLRAIATFLVYLAQNHSWVLKVGLALVVFATVLGAVGIAAWVVAGTWGNMIIVLGFMKAAVVLATYKTILYKVAIFAISVALKILFIAIKVWTAAQWLLNAALTANPIGLLVVGIAALIGLFAYAALKTGTLTDAFKFMGGILIKTVLTPINLIMSGIRGMLWLVSKIPGSMVVPEFKTFFKDAHEGMASLQDKFNLVSSGNKSQSVLGMAYDLHKGGTKDFAWMNQPQKNQPLMLDQSMMPKSVTDSLAQQKQPIIQDKTVMSMGMMYNLAQQETVNQPTTNWMEQKTKEAAAKRNELTAKLNPLEVMGNIKVQAEEGSKVVDKSFTANTGDNMYTLSGAY